MSCTLVSLEAYIATPNLAEFLKENAQSNSFLDELFIGNDKSLIDECKSSSTRKVENIKQNYETEKLIEILKIFF